MIDNELEKKYSEELMLEICKEVKGVGSATAGAIASDFDGSLSDFVASNEDRLKQIKRSSGKQILAKEQILELIDKKLEIDPSKGASHAWVSILGKKFITTAVNSVESLSISSFDFNPFLAKALDLNSPKDIITFNTYQTITRSIVTSWGNMVEDILKYSGDADKYKESGQGRSGRKPDLVKTVDNKKVYVQVKSGPNTMNVDMVNSLNEIMKEFETKEDCKFYLGMTYGTRDRISAQIKGNMNNFSSRTLIGRELWKFISGENNYHKKLFSILDEASLGLIDGGLISLIKGKINLLEEEWKVKFKDLSVDEVFEKYV